MAPLTEDKKYNEDGLVLSDAYSETMNGEVLPFLAAHRTDAPLARGDCRLFVSRFDPEGTPRGTVLIVHGFTENTDKYAELIHSLLRNDWCVLAYDQRGHGRSTRKEGLKDPSVTHVDRFSDYVDDLEAVISGPLSAMPKPWMLFAHSMGGAVSVLYMESRPIPFEKAVLSSPMIAPHLGGIPAGLVKAICRVPIALGHGDSRAFVSKPYHGPEDFETSCASGRERFEWYERLRAATPEFQNKCPTYTWSAEAIDVTKKLLAPGLPERIGIPLVIFGAENDTSVLPSAQETFVKRLKNGTRTVIPGSRHEICRSPDSVVFPWWHRILQFYGGAEA